MTYDTSKKSIFRRDFKSYNQNSLKLTEIIWKFLQFLFSADGSQFEANFLSSVFTRGLGLSMGLDLMLLVVSESNLFHIPCNNLLHAPLYIFYNRS